MINVFQAYENLSDRVDLNSAGEMLIEPLFFNNKFKINTKKKCFVLKNGPVRTYFSLKSFERNWESFECSRIQSKIRYQSTIFRVFGMY